VKGSHGICPASPKDYPLIIAEHTGLWSDETLSATHVYAVLGNLVLS
jgi:hypothetical protein